ncbi:MAG: Gx transporter family protein [Candidatus Muiribacteriota bacterium]
MTVIHGRKITIAAMLAGVSIILNLLDRALIPFFPWSKIGLANIGVFVGIEKLPPLYSAGIVFTKIFFTGIFTGVTGPGFLAALSSSIMAYFIMFFLRKLNFSIIPVSICSSVGHVFTQAVVISLILGINFHTLFKTLLVFGIMNGIITGFIVFWVLRRLKIE